MKKFEELYYCDEESKRITGGNLTFFRGAGSKKHHKLVPSAYRVTGLKSYHGEAYKEPIYEWQQVAAEAEFLFKVKYGKEAYFGNPWKPVLDIVDPFEREILLKQFLVRNFEYWMLREIVMNEGGIAQHYGMPTSLLDWSAKCGTALYFAGANAVDMLIKAFETEDYDYLNDEMVVHEFDAEKLLEIDQFFPFQFSNLSKDNQNARAQWGFLFGKTLERPYEKVLDTRPLDEQLGEYGASHMITEYSAPVIGCRALLEFLESKNINARKLFPGRQGQLYYARDLRNMEKLERMGV